MRTKQKIPAGKRGHSRSSTRTMDHATAYLMILPSFAILVVFVITPLFMALGKSFTNWSFYGTSEFIWFENFRLILTHELFLKSLLNIVKFVVIILPVQMVITFLFAHILLKLPKLVGNLVKTAIYVPNVISGVVASVIFLFIFNFRAGLLNELTKAMGIGRVAMMTNPTLALIAICVPAIWLGFGYTSLIMFAGLNNIPQSYYEAAAVDGAGFLSKLIHISIPSMKNIFILTLIGMLTGTLQMFDLPFLMTGGGPVNSTLTPMMFLFNNFRDQSVNMGYTVAGALLMMVAIGLINSVVFTVLRSEKSMDE